MQTEQTTPLPSLFLPLKAEPLKGFNEECLDAFFFFYFDMLTVFTESTDSLPPEIKSFVLRCVDGPKCKADFGRY